MTRHTVVSARPLPLSLMTRHAIYDAPRPGERWGWAALRRTLALWRQRAHSRAELDLILDDRLKDLPFDTSTIVNERAKPFWMK